MFLTEADAKRTQHFLAMVLIGDGVMALLQPSRDARAWKKGPRVWRQMMQAMARRPALTRAVGVAQVLGGVAWALAQQER